MKSELAFKTLIIQFTILFLPCLISVSGGQSQPGGEGLPDLVITNVWSDGSFISYEIYNQGDAVAHGGHMTGLIVDGLFITGDIVDQDIPATGLLERTFDWEWECSESEDLIAVHANHENGELIIDESNIDNNILEETWACEVPGLPNLVITDIWNEDSLICFQVMNTGKDPAPPDHLSALSIDGILARTLTVPVELFPGERWNGCFELAWDCSGEGDDIFVSADYENQVDETDEEDNAREEFWPCDTDAPEIIGGPFVTGVTPESAEISWETNEPSDSMVKYDSHAGIYSLEAFHPDFHTDHNITLKGLEPSSSYHFVARSTDPSGNYAESREMFFETPPLADDEPPTITLHAPGDLEGISLIYADSDDNSDVEKVEFYLNEELIFTAFSPPWKFHLNTKKFPDGDYILSARAFDKSLLTREADKNVKVANAKDPDAPVVIITSPSEGQTVSGKIQVAVTAEDSSGIFYGRFYVDGAWGGTWYPDTEGIKKTSFKFPCDTTQFSNGSVRIGFEIFDTDFNKGTGVRDIIINNTAPPAPPHLTVKRKVTRTGNWFTVELTVQNIGEESAEKVRIKDYLQLFHPISQTSGGVEYKASFKETLTRWDMDIKPSTSIPGGQSRVFQYNAVPVLLYPSSVTPIIGGHKYANSLDVWYERSGGSEIYHDQIKIASMETKSYDDACKTSDYLIVTSPKNLFVFNTESEVNELLTSMAELAKIKNGALGFLDVPASLNRSFQKYDGFSMGDIGGDSKVEFVMADQDANDIFTYQISNTTLCYNPSDPDTCFKMKWINYSRFKCGEGGKGFDQGDRMVVGDLPGGTKSEIVMMDHSADTIFTYDGKGKVLHSFKVSGIDSFDALATGDMRGSGKHDIIYGDHSTDVFSIYNWYGIKVGSFNKELDAHDLIASGDVWQDKKDEIVMGDLSQDRVFIMRNDGSLCDSFSVTLEQGDALGVGNAVHTWPVDKKEIIIGDKSEDKIYIYRSDGKLYENVSLEFDDFDGLLAGNLTGSFNDDILLADLSRNVLDIHSDARIAGKRHLLTDLVHYVHPFLLPFFGWHPLGNWSGKLKNDWTTSGYLLIVGETEIVPAWGGKQFGKLYTTLGTVMMESDCTDYPYANTIGDEIKPELSIGRIIGNSAPDLKAAIDTSINQAKGTSGYTFNRNPYFCVSGFPAGLGGNSDNIDFKKEMAKVALTLPKKGVNGVVMFTPAYTKYSSPGVIDETATHNEIVTKFFQNTPNRDVIFLSGHGNSSAWDQIDKSDVRVQTNPFGSSVPFVYAASCSTGQYIDGFTLPEAFLLEKAGAYLGATKYGLGTHDYISNRFYSTWDTGESVALGVKQTKRSLGSGTSDRYWSAIYHVFGDAKFGSEGPAPPGGESSSVKEMNPEFIEIFVPEPEVIREDEFNYVTIPEGGMFYEPERPQVPTYTMFFEYSPETQIQNVVLLHRSDARTSTGLNIPETVVGLGGKNVLSGPGQNRISYMAPEWWPEKEFEWEVIENPESKTLAVTVYPVYYNRITTDLRFHDYYHFEALQTGSETQITSLKTTRPEYDPGDEVVVHFDLFNEGPPQDVLLNAGIIQESSGKTTDGLSLRTLKEFAGRATYVSSWNAEGAETGYYVVDAELRNLEGLLLDRKSTTFRVGTVSGEITEFNTVPEKFEPGEIVDISLIFKNSGSLPTSGTAMIRIIHEEAGIVEEFDHEISNLLPEEEIRFHNAWDTTGREEGAYKISAIVRYEAEATDPKMIYLNTDTGRSIIMY